MDNSDKKAFAELFNGLSEYYQKPPLSVPAIQIYFAALERFHITEVSQAISMHVQNPESGTFYPKASDLVNNIEGGGFTADQIIAMARLKRTPLGVLCAQHIGQWNLDQGDPFMLKQIAEECLQLLPVWKDASRSGNFSDHTIKTMLKYEVSPVAPFAEGYIAPMVADDTQQRILAVMAEINDERLKLEQKPQEPELTDEEIAENKRKLAALFD